jgi:Protein of unknown function (DUF3102)
VVQGPAEIQDQSHREARRRASLLLRGRSGETSAVKNHVHVTHEHKTKLAPGSVGPTPIKQLTKMNKVTISSKTSQQIICASELAQVTRRYHKILSAARASLDEAIEIGGFLVRIKAKLGHGNWLPWAEKKLPFSVRRAEYWMSLFENRQDRKFANASNLSSAYKLLTGPVIDVETKVVDQETNLNNGGDKVRREVTAFYVPINSAATPTLESKETLEARVESSIDDYVNGCNALEEIREQRLWREDFNSFDDYLIDKGLKRVPWDDFVREPE